MKICKTHRKRNALFGSSHRRISKQMHSTFLIFLYLAVLFGCTENENYSNLLRTDAATNNSAATQLLGLLQKENNGVQHLLSMTEPYEPMLEHTSLSMSSEYGMSFMVPYGDSSTHRVFGMVRYPVDYKSVGDNKINIGKHLSTPTKIDSRILNDDIDIRKRYLYSSYFKQLCDSTNNESDSILTAYTSLEGNPKNLDNISLQAYSSPMEFSQFYDKDHIVITAYYESTYIGNDYTAVYGLHPLTIVSTIRDCMNYLNIPEYKYDIDHSFLQTLKIGVVTENFQYPVVWFVNYLLQMTANILYSKGFSVHFQYTYDEYIKNNSQPYPSGNSGSYTGGTSPGDGNGGSGNGNNDTQPATVIENDCDSIENSGDIKLRAKALVDTILNVKPYPGNVTNVEWNSFTDSIAKNPAIEYGTALNDYGEYGYHLTKIDKGSADTISILHVDTINTLGVIHYHPNGAPPSAHDLLSIVELGKYSDKVQSSLIYTRDSVLYSLQITDRSKLSSFYDKIKNEIDSTTHGFKKGGEADLIISRRHSTFDGLSYNMTHLLHIALILKEMDAGIQLVCTNLNEDNKKFTIYSVKKNNTDYKPIKCQ